MIYIFKSLNSGQPLFHILVSLFILEKSPILKLQTVKFCGSRLLFGGAKFQRGPQNLWLHGWQQARTLINKPDDSYTRSLFKNTLPSTCRFLFFILLVADALDAQMQFTSLPRLTWEQNPESKWIKNKFLELSLLL